MNNIKNVNDQKQIYVCFTIDNNYVPYCMTTIRSILINSTLENNFTFIIVSKNINLFNKIKFLLLNKIKKSKFIFIEIKDKIFFLSCQFLMVRIFLKLIILD